MTNVERAKLLKLVLAAQDALVEGPQAAPVVRVRLLAALEELAAVLSEQLVRDTAAELVAAAASERPQHDPGDACEAHASAEAYR